MNNTIAKRTIRNNETEEYRVKRLESNARSTATARKTEADEARIERLSRDARSTVAARETENNLDRSRRLTNDAHYHTIIRQHMQYRVDNITFLESNVSPHTCGLMAHRCQFCNSLNFIDERPSDGKYNNCCHKGKIVLLSQPTYPTLSKDILSNEYNPNFSKFNKSIRSHNSAISFGSKNS